MSPNFSDQTDRHDVRKSLSDLTHPARMSSYYYYYYYFSTQGISNTEGEEKELVRKCKRWNDQLLAQVVCRLKTVMEQDSVESLNDNR